MRRWHRGKPGCAHSSLALVQMPPLRTVGQHNPTCWQCGITSCSGTTSLLWGTVKAGQKPLAWHKAELIRAELQKGTGRSCRRGGGRTTPHRDRPVLPGVTRPPQRLPGICVFSRSRCGSAAGPRPGRAGHASGSRRI